MEVLEKEWANEMLVLLGTFIGFKCEGALVGGGGMFGALTRAADGVAAVLDLDMPLVWRGDGFLRKVTRACSAPELLESWLLSSVTSMLDGP